MAVILNKANLVLKDANGNIGKIEQLSDRDLAKIKTAVSDVALVVNQSNHKPIAATTTNKGVVQLATSADVVAGASDKVVTAAQLHNVTTITKATYDGAGNVITDTYVKKTGNETISGVKTFTDTINANGFIGFKSTQDGIGGGFANYLNNNRVCDVWGQPSGADKTSLIHLRIKDYGTDGNLAYLQIGGNNQTKQGYISFNDKNLVRSVNGVNADINGNVSITSVANATKASQDSAGQQINNTYVKGVTASNATITVTKGNGTTSTATINNVANATNATKASQDSAGQQINNTYVKGVTASNATITVTKGNGTTSTATINNVANATNATKATQDSAGQQINTTYIKGVSVSGRTVTFTRGNGTTFAITTQDTNTTYDLSPYAKKSDLYNSLAGYFGSTAVGGIRTVKFASYPNEVTAGTSVAGSKLFAVDGSTRLSGTWKVTDRLYNILASSGGSGHVDYNSVLAIRIA